MNSENSKTPDLTDKINLKRSHKYVALSNLSIYYTWKMYKSHTKNNKFKISSSMWNKRFKLLYSISDIQKYFQYIIINMKQFLIILQ